MKSRLSTTQTQEIQALLDQFSEAWNAKDLTAFLALFTEDAEFTDVVNQTAIGKEGIQKQHEFAFNKVMKNASLEMSNLYAREIQPDIVLVTANWLNKNSQTPDGKPLPDRNGILQMVIVNIDKQWKFKIVHNADFSLPYQKRERFVK